MSQIMLIGPPLKIRLLMYLEKIYNLSKWCETKFLVSVKLCTYIIPHSEAQTFTCEKTRRTHLLLKGDLKNELFCNVLRLIYMSPGEIFQEIFWTNLLFQKKNYSVTPFCCLCTCNLYNDYTIISSVTQGSEFCHLYKQQGLLEACNIWF